MACCLMAQSHWLNQCYNFISACGKSAISQVPNQESLDASHGSMEEVQNWAQTKLLQTHPNLKSPVRFALSGRMVGHGLGSMEKKCLYCIEAKDVASSSWTTLRGQIVFLEGSTNFKVDVLQDHEKSLGHMNAKSIVESKEKPLHETTASRATQQMSLKAKNSIILKIRNVHAVVKMGRPFKDYAYVCNLDKAKGLDHCTTYNNPPSAMRFLHAIVETVRVKTRDIIDSCRFVSLTCDGSMDCCGKEQESVYLRTCHEGKVIQRFLTIGQPESGCAEDIYCFFKEAIYNVWDKLCGFGSDGAANMIQRV